MQSAHQDQDQKVLPSSKLNTMKQQLRLYESKTNKRLYNIRHILNECMIHQIDFAAIEVPNGSTPF